MVVDAQLIFSHEDIQGDADDIYIIGEHHGSRRMDERRGCPSGSSPPDIWNRPAPSASVSQSQARPCNQNRDVPRRTILAVVTLDDENDDTVSSTSPHRLLSSIPKRRPVPRSGQPGLDLVGRVVIHEVD